MKYNIGKNWLSTFEVMVKKPAVLMPFIVIAFIEGIGLEIIYFAARGPLALAFNPIIKKFFGEAFLHYPGNIIVMGKSFYNLQLAIYIVLGAALSAVSVNIFRNIKEGLPLKTNALIKNAMKNYVSYFIYGIVVIALIFIAKKVDGFIIRHLVSVISRIGFLAKPLVYFMLNIAILFFTNILLQILIVLTVPLIVLRKLNIFKALWTGMLTGILNLRTLFVLLMLPFMVYFPISTLKGFSGQLSDKFFPEVNVLITAVGIILTVFCDSFVILSASQFVLDIKSAEEKKT